MCAAPGTNRSVAQAEPVIVFKPLALLLPPGVAALVGDRSQSFSVEGTALSSAGITLLLLTPHFQRFILSCLVLLRLQRQHVRCSTPIPP